MQPADEDEKNRGTYPLVLIFAMCGAPHLHFLHFHVFDKPNASFVAARAYGALSLWQPILFLSHRLPHLCVRLLARFRFLLFIFTGFMGRFSARAVAMHAPPS